MWFQPSGVHAVHCTLHARYMHAAYIICSKRYRNSIRCRLTLSVTERLKDVTAQFKLNHFLPWTGNYQDVLVAGEERERNNKKEKKTLKTSSKSRTHHVFHYFRITWFVFARREPMSEHVPPDVTHRARRPVRRKTGIRGKDSLSSVQDADYLPAIQRQSYKRWCVPRGRCCGGYLTREQQC